MSSIPINFVNEISFLAGTFGGVFGYPYRPGAKLGPGLKY